MMLERNYAVDGLAEDVIGILETDTFLTGLPAITAVGPVPGGVAHRVFGIDTDDGRFYLKIRGDHFATIPAIACNPEDIAHEYRALTVFGDIAPDHFPKVMSFDAARHYLIVSDVIGPDGIKMESLLSGESPVPDGLYRTYGETVGTVVRAAAAVREPIREGGDDTYYRTVLSHRLGYRNHPVLNRTIARLAELPDRQLIMGDPAPKNIGVRDGGGKLTFFDLETAHLGNPVFDYAYGLAHVALHTADNPDRMMAAAADYLKGYGDAPYDPALARNIVLGVMLYRLNGIIPYPVPLPPDGRQRLETAVLAALDDTDNQESWYDSAERLFPYG
jgi:hypothetical protein